MKADISLFAGALAILLALPALAVVAASCKIEKRLCADRGPL
jgi:hypothetical protein